MIKRLSNLEDDSTDGKVYQQTPDSREINDNFNVYSLANG